MKKIMCFVALDVLCGCAATSVPIHGPNGETWVGIACTHTKVGCYAEASEQCPGGYDIQESRDDSLIVKCRGKSKSEMPKVYMPTSNVSYD